ncbi:MAG: glutamate-1-semialdehyde 2,1-aminomutase [Planctomycetes bacterium]|nr:glutamate-1-semialdehyde 2,1-aminomutase [Planctomycetota bacterium]
MPTKSEEYFEKASSCMPGGVNSPVRAFKSVKGSPPFILSAKGACMTDVDGRQYTDYVASWGPLILGHAHDAVVAAVQEKVTRGLSFGACHPDEIRLANLIRENMPHIELLRLVNSGTEATMSALRLARAATGRDGVIKFQGCYHGHADSFLIAAGSGALTFGTPSSPGVTAGAAKDTLLASYNDLSSVEKCFAENDGKIACLIVEPVAGNMGVIPPAEGFLKGLRDLCDKHGALLIFDEVITGFRLGLGGASEYFGVKPDLTALGKIIGGGMPVGAFGGRADLMRMMSPEGSVYQAGTLSGNPLACAAGIATIETLMKEDPYERIAALAEKLAEGTLANLKEAGIKATGNRVESMGTIFFGVDSVGNFADAMKSDTELYARYHAAMLGEGVYLAPSQFEASFVSTAHDDEIIEQTLAAQRRALKKL